jgi:Protein of unknown function (DUF1552)
MMKPLDRRTLLRGTGIALSLPLLEAMAPMNKTAFAASATPARMMAYYTPNGMSMRDWTPTTFGKNYELSNTLKPLASVKDKILVLKGLDGRGPMDSQGGGAHPAGTGAFFTGVQVQKFAGTGAISVDQIAAKALGRNTRLDSLVTGIENTAGTEAGYHPMFCHNISFVDPITPKPKITDPMTVFNTIVSSLSGGAIDPDASRRMAAKKSVLDYVANDAQKLANKLGQQDKNRVDEYLSNVRAIEANLEGMNLDATACPHENIVTNYAVRQEKIKVMADLQALAFECDVTRIQTFMLADSGTNFTYSFLGISDGHHNLSNSFNHAQIRIIDHWEIQMFAYLLEQLNLKKDPSGKSLLDSCAIYFGNEISDGASHNCNNLPVLLAGSCNGYFATGQHIDVTNVKYTNVLLSMLDAFGVKMDALGNSTGLFYQGMV